MRRFSGRIRLERRERAQARVVMRVAARGADTFRPAGAARRRRSPRSASDDPSGELAEARFGRERGRGRAQSKRRISSASPVHCLVSSGWPRAAAFQSMCRCDSPGCQARTPPKSSPSTRVPSRGWRVGASSRGSGRVPSRRGINVVRLRAIRRSAARGEKTERDSGCSRRNAQFLKTAAARGRRAAVPHATPADAGQLRRKRPADFPRPRRAHSNARTAARRRGLEARRARQDRRRRRPGGIASASRSRCRADSPTRGPSRPARGRRGRSRAGRPRRCSGWRRHTTWRRAPRTRPMACAVGRTQTRGWEERAATSVTARRLRASRLCASARPAVLGAFQILAEPVRHHRDADRLQVLRQHHVAALHQRPGLRGVQQREPGARRESGAMPAAAGLEQILQIVEQRRRRRAPARTCVWISRQRLAAITGSRSAQQFAAIQPEQHACARPRDPARRVRCA